LDVKGSTEDRNPLSVGIDGKPVEEVLRIINREDQRVPGVVATQIPVIARAVEAVTEAIRGGGRVFFAGAGTSGRLGVIEAAELPPTFGVSPDLFRAIIAGGPEAVFGSVEAAEDDEAAGAEALRSGGLSGGDILVALSASGRTPFTVGALREAKRRGARTVSVTSSQGAPINELADISIVVETGPEIVAGSTRMKAGTAQKLVLNMLTTAAMIRLGMVHDGYMIGVQPTSRKLRRRAVGIVGGVADVSPEEAEEALDGAGGDLKAAVLMAKTGVNLEEAKRVLGEAGGILRLALEKMEKRE
jgi:N-acetylmuramic acid 6-phosphate etherase